MVRVVTAGHVNWDVTLRVDALPEPDGEARIESQRAAGGGSAANVACALAGLGVESGVVGSVGDDENGLLARRELDRAGVDTEHLLVADGAETSVKYLVVAADGDGNDADEGEVMVLGNEGANEAVGPGDVDAGYVAAAEHLHLTSQRPETAAYLADVAAEAGMGVSFDPGRRLGERDYGEVVDAADLLFLNEREAETLLENRRGGESASAAGSGADVGDSPSRLRDAYLASDLRDQVVVVKHGAAGATVYTPDRTYEHPGFDVGAVDTTGAGDAFAAGFVATLLDDPGGYERALEYGNACGALAARDEGARAAPTAPEVDGFLDEWVPGG